MCRWFAYLSTEDVLLADPLLRTQHSIVRQISAHWLPNIHVEYMATDDGSPNILSNVDGFGVGKALDAPAVAYVSSTQSLPSAWYTRTACEFDPSAKSLDLRPVLYKTVRPPLNDLSFISIAENVASSCIIAHVRAATGLTPVTEQNSHPFVFGRFTFAHNGTVAHFFEIRVALLEMLSPASRRNILGTTDTEHAAALFFTILDPDGPWTKEYPLAELQAALKKTVETLHGLVDKVGLPPGVVRLPSFLNFVLTDGEQMLATRYAYPAGTEPPSLYYSSLAGPTLNRKYEDNPDGPDVEVVESDAEDYHPRQRVDYKKHVIIASEPTTYHLEDWTLITANSLLAVGKDLEIKVTKI
ncbi:glutamine amidotransferase, partial [Phenoliferia sp. Uapishka_3]